MWESAEIAVLIINVASSSPGFLIPQCNKVGAKAKGKENNRHRVARTTFTIGGWLNDRRAVRDGPSRAIEIGLKALPPGNSVRHGWRGRRAGRSFFGFFLNRRQHVGKHLLGYYTIALLGEMSFVDKV